jgi:predicted rRNA methylase YqxC with S4 and FtsJ domains
MPIETKGTLKLKNILDRIPVDIEGSVCADFGCNVGGFTQTLLNKGAAKVYAIDTGYGALDWNLRQNESVIVKERCNALYLDSLEEKLDMIVIDMAWTKQVKALPAALKHLKKSGVIVSLLKPQYEIQASKKGKARILTKQEGFDISCDVFRNCDIPSHLKKSLHSSPIQGGTKQKGSYEFWIVLRPKKQSLEG